jgi:hypothetical protein
VSICVVLAAVSVVCCELSDVDVPPTDIDVNGFVVGGIAVGDDIVDRIFLDGTGAVVIERHTRAWHKQAVVVEQSCRELSISTNAIRHAKTHQAVRIIPGLQVAGITS